MSKKLSKAGCKHKIKVENRQFLEDFDSRFMVSSVHQDDDSDSSSASEWCYMLGDIRMSRPKKKQNFKHFVPLLISSIKHMLGKNKYEPIHILQDSGKTDSIILHQYVKKICTRQSQKTTLWKTMGGVFMTMKEHKILFQWPELNSSKLIEWNVHVNTTVPPHVNPNIKWLWVLASYKS